MTAFRRVRSCAAPFPPGGSPCGCCAESVARDGPTSAGGPAWTATRIPGRRRRGSGCRAAAARRPAGDAAAALLPAAGGRRRAARGLSGRRSRPSGRCWQIPSARARRCRHPQPGRRACRSVALPASIPGRRGKRCASPGKPVRRPAWRGSRRPPAPACRRAASGNRPAVARFPAPRPRPGCPPAGWPRSAPARPSCRRGTRPDGGRRNGPGPAPWSVGRP
ncbi:conserved hypothetical protein [Chromobacterium violaceum ATCC 12472]|uniref:Uncharacterized protein n=1 Tax=Chromobacterium violaceum (strain ATCC 12472 / DSM 30191 / JCM 1249 / CCUG 213 / NBRC 12614 / NCIMB 9131 / NCTC 9757 / MK) TaxID=243365 RepID=Q7NT88_CHRVO|nr:conserved hypothetical protein [Chromobacterium violaceum ATCC 12472]